MPFNLKLEHLIVGYTAHDVYEGEEATLVVRSFTSSENKELFKRLVHEGLPSDLIKKIPNGNFEQGTLVNEMVAILISGISVEIALR